MGMLTNSSVNKLLKLECKLGSHLPLTDVFVLAHAVPLAWNVRYHLLQEVFSDGHHP